MWQTGHSAEPGIKAIPASSLEGEAFSNIAHPGHQELTVGDNGLTYRNGAMVTALHWSDVEAVVHTSESERCLYAKEGPPLSVNSSEWERGNDLIGSIDESLPRSRHIDAC